MELILIAIVGAVLIAAALAWFNRSTGADVDGDGDVDLKDVKLAIEKTKTGVEETAKEVKTRVKRVKEEVADVAVAAKETVKQTKDVVAAAKGKKRAGRRPSEGGKQKAK